MKFDKYLCLYTLIWLCVKMWMSVLWDLTVTNMQDVRTQRAPTPAHVSTLTVETARTAQVTRCNTRSIAVYFILIHMQTCLFCVPTRASEVREPRVSRLRSQRWQQLSDGRWGCFWLRQRLRAGRLFPPPLPGNWKLGQSSPILQRWGGVELWCHAFTVLQVSQVICTLLLSTAFLALFDFLHFKTYHKRGPFSIFEKM